MREKHKLFCDEFLIDLNGKQSAIRAGYSAKRAEVTASELLSKKEVQEYISEKQKDRAVKVGVSQEWVLARLKEISDRCMQAEEVMIRGANGEMIGTGEYKFDSSGAVKATELLGKHVGFFETDNRQKDNTTVVVPYSDQQVDKIIKSIRETKSR